MKITRYAWVFPGQKPDDIYLHPADRVGKDWESPFKLIRVDIEIPDEVFEHEVAARSSAVARIVES